ncbi:MAG: hypothetical protein QM762_12830 [Chryseolinea sp.]
MKQSGTTWTTAEGSPTLVKYLPKHLVLHEKLGQKIVTEAKFIEQRLREAKAMFIDLAKEALRNNPDQSQKTKFTFYTFDHEYKFEYDVKEDNIRVYRATKQNPASKDYDLVVLDLNKSDLLEKPTAINNGPAAEDFINHGAYPEPVVYTKDPEAPKAKVTFDEIAPAVVSQPLNEEVLDGPADE